MKTLQPEQQEFLNELGLKSLEDRIDSVIIEYYKPYERTVITDDGFSYCKTESILAKETELKDVTVEEMCEKFYRRNRALTYVNYSFYKFKDPKYKKLYDLYIDMYDGNFFLHVDVKHGSLID